MKRTNIRKRDFKLEDVKELVEKNIIQSSKGIVFDTRFSDDVLLSTMMRDDTRVVSICFEEEFFHLKGFSEVEKEELKKFFKEIKESLENEQQS